MWKIVAEGEDKGKCKFRPVTFHEGSVGLGPIFL